MGSTVSVGRRVGAFRTPGKIWYALFETTYESNCWPHTPSECCVGFGTLDQVARRILRFVYCTAGGMLRGPGGRLTPRGYLGAWLKELKRPFLLADQRPGVKLGDGWGYRADPAQAGEARANLTAAGFGAIAAELAESESVTVSLYDQAELIAYLCNEVSDDPQPAWMLVHCPLEPAPEPAADCAFAAPKLPYWPPVSVMSAGATVQHGPEVYAATRLAVPDAVPVFWAMGDLADVQGDFMLHVAKHIGAYPSPALALLDARRTCPNGPTGLVLADSARLRVDFVEKLTVAPGGSVPLYWSGMLPKLLAGFADDERAGPYGVATTWGRIKAVRGIKGNLDTDLVRALHLDGPEGLETRIDEHPKARRNARAKIEVGQRWTLRTGVKAADGTPLETARIERKAVNGRQWIVVADNGERYRISRCHFDRLMGAKEVTPREFMAATGMRPDGSF